MAAVDKKLLALLAQQDKNVEKLMDAFCMELAKSGIPYSVLPKDDIFNFRKYPTVSKNVEKIVQKYREKFRVLINKSVRTSVVLALGKLEKNLSTIKTLQGHILGARANRIVSAFIDYRMKPKKGMSLSDRIWNYTEQTKAEFELGLSQVLEDGIRTGESAEEIGRKVRDKLRQPDMMYRRYHLKKTMADGSKKDVVEWRRKVVDKNGKVHFVKEDLEKVGSGVCRSSRQNTLRMAATEINMAYDYAEIKGLQTEPYILGYRIKLSPTNHTCRVVDANGKVRIIKPFYDICDELTGAYPKWFMWTGWHPRCRCYIEPILCSEDEMRYISRLPQDQYEKYKSPNFIKELPENYLNYLSVNKDRIERSVERGTQPYWIADNYIDSDPSKGLVYEQQPQESTTIEKAEARHAARTEEEIADH